MRLGLNARALQDWACTAAGAPKPGPCSKPQLPSRCSPRVSKKCQQLCGRSGKESCSAGQDPLPRLLPSSPHLTLSSPPLALCCSQVWRSYTSGCLPPSGPPPPAGSDAGMTITAPAGSTVIIQLPGAATGPFGAAAAPASPGAWPAAFAAQAAGPSVGSAAAQGSWYDHAVQYGAAVQQRFWQPNTVHQRDRAWQEFDSWCRARLLKPATACTPTDVVVYLCSWWIGAHGRQVLPNGATAPAPGSLTSLVSQLSTRLEEAGRRGVWDPSSGCGNPCKSFEVRHFCGGYANLMHAAGFQPQAVPPLPEWKLGALVAALLAEADNARGSGAPWHVEALLRRDAALAQLLWESERRPGEVGQLTTPAVTLGGAQFRAQAATSKMCHPSHGPRQPRPITVAGAGGALLQELLEGYARCLGRCGQGLGPFLFSPLRRDGSGLDTGRGLSSAAMTKRIEGHLRRLHLYAGESIYSLKRGAMQHAFFARGETLQAIGEAADIDTPAVVGLYLDPTRHQRPV